jgi:glycosyltransferase involved in cell wall biosynthesis
LRKIVKRQGLHEQVEFLGQVSPDELAGLYRRCAVFVFPSSVETFGNPLVEAMASGAPIASSNSAAMPEVVGDAALFFDPADVGGMAATLDRLLEDAELRRELGARALANSGDFSWPKTAARTLDVLKEAAQRPSPGR